MELLSLFAHSQYVVSSVDIETKEERKNENWILLHMWGTIDNEYKTILMSRMYLFIL